MILFYQIHIWEHQSSSSGQTCKIPKGQTSSWIAQKCVLHRSAWFEGQRPKLVQIKKNEVKGKTQIEWKQEVSVIFNHRVFHSLRKLCNSSPPPQKKNCTVSYSFCMSALRFK